MYGKPAAGRRVAHPEYHSLTLPSRRRKPEFVSTSCPAVPGHGPEGADRGGHRREHLMPSQHAQRGAHPAQQRPPADRGAHGHAHAQHQQNSSPGEHSATEPGPVMCAPRPCRGNHINDAGGEEDGAADQRPPGRRFRGAVSGAGRHLIHPQSPGTRLTRTYPCSTQNTAPNEAGPAPPSTGAAPLHTSTPIANSTAPTASSARLHRFRGIRSARRIAVAPSTPGAPQYSLLAPATTRTTPQLTTNPAAIDDMA